MNVKILCTCNDPELIDAAMLVFGTIRTGFPENDVQVFINPGIQENHLNSICQVCSRLYLNVTDAVPCPALHHQWIEKLVQTENEPFFICDTDVIFWKQFEYERFNRPIAGNLIPFFFDRFTKANTMPRLHTSLMYIDPVAVRKELKAIKQWINPSRFNPIINPFYPVQIPGKNGDLFYDTCALLYHAIGGQEFTDSQLDCYDHLHAGTWVRELHVAYPEFNWPDAHKEFYANPESARGIWRKQKDFYAKLQPASFR